MPELAREYKVSIRTIQRDILELERLLPLDIKTGKHLGGIYVKGDYSLYRMYMHDDEIELLLKITEMVGSLLSDSELKTMKKLISDYTKPR